MSVVSAVWWCHLYSESFHGCCLYRADVMCRAPRGGEEGGLGSSIYHGPGAAQLVLQIRDCCNVPADKIQIYASNTYTWTQLTAHGAAAAVQEGRSGIRTLNVLCSHFRRHF
eukprot:g78421.t1